jgi:membrane-associated phospholipid phosphatase
LNLWLLPHASITFATFPSAHVASTMAAALALLCVLPVTGILFLLLSLSIAIGAVVGRYHYAVDVLLGAFTAIAFFVAQSARWR